jgi:5'-nucleotidase
MTKTSTIRRHPTNILWAPVRESSAVKVLLAAGVLMATVVACGGSGDDPVASVPFQVKIIGFNDYHGNLQSPGTFGVNTSVAAASRPAVGGADYIAGYVSKLKAQNSLNVVVGAGDFIGASPLISALFHDESAIETLNRIGVEFNAVGNHEFDQGSTELLRLQNGGCLVKNGVADANSCKGATVGTPVPFEGAKFKWLSANVVSTATGKTLLPAYGIKTFNGVKVAFIGMTLKATPTIVTPTGVAGLEFKDEAATVNALIAELRAQGIESIVVLVHQGGFQAAGLSDINGCDGDLVGSDIANIVKQLDDAVDLVISGHTHAAYNCSGNTLDVKSIGGVVTSTPRAAGLANAKGRLVPVTSTSAFGRVLTDIDVTIDPATRDIKTVAATNRLVDRTDTSVTPSAAVKSIVDAYNNLVSPLASKVIGAISKELPASASDAACNMPAGDLIADAQLAATAPSGFGDAVIAFMNRGGVRSPGFTFTSSAAGEGDGNVTYGEAFTTQPFGNSLVTLTLTAQNLKDVLEQQFAGCRGQSATATRVMIPSTGFKYVWDGAKACDARISSVTLTRNGATEIIVDAAGTVLAPTKTYRVTVNNFMATGGDGFTTFLSGTNALGGAQDIDALTAFMAGYKAPLQPYVLGGNVNDSGSTRIQRNGGTSCPTGATVNS